MISESSTSCHYVILNGTKRNPENLAVGAFIIFLRFARFLGKLGMTKKVGANQNPNVHSPSSHVIQSEAKPKRGTPDGRKVINPYVILSGATAQP